MTSLETLLHECLRQVPAEKCAADSFWRIVRQWCYLQPVDLREVVAELRWRERQMGGRLDPPSFHCAKEIFAQCKDRQTRQRASDSSSKEKDELAFFLFRLQLFKLKQSPEKYLKPRLYMLGRDTKKVRLVCVVGMRQRNPVDELKIHYIGFQDETDEWVPKDCERLSLQCPEDQ